MDLACPDQATSDVGQLYRLYISLGKHLMQMTALQAQSAMT